MRIAETAIAGPVSVLIATSVGHNCWASRQAILHYENSRLIRADGADLTQSGPRGLTGTLYVVKDTISRDNRRVMRLERQKIVDGEIVGKQNWGEIEDRGLQSA